MNKYQNQKIKFFYYLFNTVMLLVPRIFFRWMMKPELRKIDFYDKKYILSRVSYYNKVDKSFKTSDISVTCEELRQELSGPEHYARALRALRSLRAFSWSCAMMAPSALVLLIQPIPVPVSIYATSKGIVRALD